MKKEKSNEFEQYISEVIDSINATKKIISEEKKNRKYVNFSSYPLEKLKEELREVMAESFATKDVKGVELLTPPAHIVGDFTLEIFNLAKKLGEEPNVLAKKIADNINKRKGVLIHTASVVGVFINVETNKSVLYREILANILSLKDSYGESDVNAGKVVIIDYSAPNIAKPIGVGHLRSTIIGQALSNIYYKTGYIVIKDNHLGDWGTQFGSLIYAYNHWGDEDKIAKNPIFELKNLYVKFHEFSKEQPKAKEDARELFARLDQKDSELVALWKRFRDLSLNDFSRVYERLGIKFDINIGESFFAERADKIVDECLKNGFCRKDEASEAVIVDQIDSLPSFLLRKQDGSSLYLTRDLATLEFRSKTFKPNTILYVVGNEQDLHFKQLFEFARFTKYLPANINTKHISFGLVFRDGEKMSTRRGTLIELDDLIFQSVKKSKEILLQKNPNVNIQNLDKSSETIGIGAIIYNDLRQSMARNISFNWDRMLDFEAGSAVYLQYSYARINSILKKLTDIYGKIDLDKLEKSDLVFINKSEFNLAKKLMMFPGIIVKSQETDSPHHICVYLEELALLFNSFYNEVSILKTEEQNLRNSRLALSSCVALVIKKGLSLLSINVLERM
jgi:arginyl-tRNA synthetase